MEWRDFFLVFFLFFISIDIVFNFIPSIPPVHIGCWFRNQPDVVRRKIIDSCNGYPAVTNSSEFFSCKYLISVNETELPCWGYEDDLPPDRSCLLYKSICDGPSQSWAADQNEQIDTFFFTADFGYIHQLRQEISYYCRPKKNSSNISQLKCSSYLRYCQAKNIFIDLSNVLKLPEPIRYREDILRYGDIGGWNCDLDRNALLKENGHKSPLMSWFAEVSNFKIEPNKKCDITIEKPAMIMKLDASINMYHHFCDFLNLYLTLHLNQTFHQDIQIIIWDTYPYRSNFHPMWKVFTKNPLLNLADLNGKTICFNDIIFPLLPRMIYGFYYNMPLIPGCRNSGIFRAFNRHVLYHLGFPDSEKLSTDETIRITFLDRTTKYRRVLNQETLLKRLREALPRIEHFDKIEIHVVDFNHRMPFLEQVRISSRTDILIGMHGAGLTHTLFQPDYGILFELYNCEDNDCYRDLARLRGVEYFTWKDRKKLTVVTDETQRADEQSTGAAHAKFVNYNFDPDEFVRITMEAIKMVRHRKATFHRDQIFKSQIIESKINNSNNNSYYNKKIEL